MAAYEAENNIQGALNCVTQGQQVQTGQVIAYVGHTGRAIRTETDTCAVSILDPRAAPDGRYHRAVLDALPKMTSTQDIHDVEHFIRAVKGAEYFFCLKQPRTFSV